MDFGQKKYNFWLLNDSMAPQGHAPSDDMPPWGHFGSSPTNAVSAEEANGRFRESGQGIQESVIVIRSSMSILTLKDKPDLLFNNPLKQKVYVFLKHNPGKDYETFQVLTGDATVSRQHFNEVEQAIKSREERDRARPVIRDAGALFLHGAPFDKPKAGLAGLGLSDKTEAKEFPLKKIEKKKMNERAKQYIKDNPGCTYDELVQNLGFKELSKPHFFSMKTLLRKKGLIPEESRTRRGRKAGDKNAANASARSGASESSQSISFANMKTIEILDSIDASGFSDEIREHYKSHVLPMLQKLMPQGQKLQIVFLTDPPTIELRRVVVR